MPRPKGKVPAYQRHKHSGQAFVKLNDEFVYLGPHGSKVSIAEYDRVVSEWLANGRRLLPREDQKPELVVNELAAPYLDFAQRYYRKHDQPTSEQAHFRRVLQLLVRTYGRTPIIEFTPLRLKALRQQMIGLDWSRTYIGSQIGRIKRMFKWGVEHELVPPHVLQSLEAVAGLRKGRSDARETGPVKPVAGEFVEAIRAHVSRQVWALVELQGLTGMRSGELVIMRGCDLDMTGDLWEYRPSEYKTEHFEEDKVIPLGVQAQTVIRPFLKPDTGAYLFSPIDAEAERRARIHAERKTPLSCGNRPGTNRKRKPKRTPGERYDRDSYRRAIQQACKKAFPPPEDIADDAEAVEAWHKAHRWFPHQIRHTRGTEVRKKYGLEGSQAHLGHKQIKSTEIYAERNRTLAREIARQIG